MRSPRKRAFRELNNDGHSPKKTGHPTMGGGLGEEAVPKAREESISRRM